MSLYRVHFKWKQKDIELTARSLDLTHPYFVSIKDLVFPKEKRLIINPEEDEIRKAFKDTNHILIPFQTVVLIEELIQQDEHEATREVKRDVPRVVPFNSTKNEKPEKDTDQAETDGEQPEG